MPSDKASVASFIQTLVTQIRRKTASGDANSASDLAQLQDLLVQATNLGDLVTIRAVYFGIFDIYHSTGRFDDAIATMQTAYDICAASTNPDEYYLRVGPVLNQGVVHGLIGDNDTALAAYRHALALADDIPDQQLIPSHYLLWVNIGEVLLKMGNIKEANYYFRRVYELEGTTTKYHIAAIAMAYIGTAHIRLLEGFPDDARDRANMALELSTRHNLQRQVFQAHCSLAHIIEQFSKDTNQAQEHYRQALAALDDVYGSLYNIEPIIDEARYHAMRGNREMASYFASIAQDRLATTTVEAFHAELSALIG